MSDLAIPLEGIRRAESQLNATASRIARYPSSSLSAYTSGAGTTSEASDTVDLSSAAVSLMQSRQVADANIKAAQSMDQVQKSLIDILG